MPTDGYPGDAGPAELDVAEWLNADVDIVQPWAPVFPGGANRPGGEAQPGSNVQRPRGAEGAVSPPLAADAPQAPAVIVPVHHIVHHVSESMDRAGADFTTYAFSVAGQGYQQLVGRDNARRYVTLINDPDGTVNIYFGKEGGIGASNRIKLKPGASFKLETRAAVYASCALATDVATVYVYCERNEESDTELASRN